MTDTSTPNLVPPSTLEANPLPVPEPTDSTKHDSILASAKTFVENGIHWFENVLPDHDLKDTVLGNLRQAWDNTVALVRQDAERALKAVEAAKAELPAVEQVLADAGEQAVSGVAKEVESAVGESLPAAATPSTGGASTASEVPPTTSASAPSTGTSDTPSATPTAAPASASETPTAG